MYRPLSRQSNAYHHSLGEVVTILTALSNHALFSHSVHLTLSSMNKPPDPLTLSPCLFFSLTCRLFVRVFGGFGERVCVLHAGLLTDTRPTAAADGFVFACADICLHAAAGVGALGHGVALRLLPQRRLLRVRQPRQRGATGAEHALRPVSLQGHHQDRRASHRRVRHCFLLPIFSLFFEAKLYFYEG